MAVASSHGAVGIDEATLERDRRAAEQPMGVWKIAPGMYGVGSGAGSDYSEYVVDVHECRCTCQDWTYRGEPGSGEISRCKHASRVLQVLGVIGTPADVDASPELTKQREVFR